MTKRSSKVRVSDTTTTGYAAGGFDLHAVLVSTRGGGLQADVSINITKNTGGRYRARAAPTALPDVLIELGAAIGARYDEVKNRYRTVYECEDDNPDRIQARVNRPAVAVRLFSDRRTGP